MGRIQRFLGGLVLLVSLALFLMPPPAGVKTDMLRAGALVLLAVGFWATGVLPEFVTALLFILLSVLSSVAPLPVIFSGFSSQALWLVFGGMILVGAVRRTGLGERIAGRLLDLLGGSYPRVIGGIVSLTLVAGFFMPSTIGRVLLFVPIVSTMAEQLGFEREAPGRKGMILAAILGCYVPSCSILPSNVPNMVLAGTAESLYQITFSYSSYLKLHFPVTGVIKGLAIIPLICLLFPDRLRHAPAPRQKKKTPLNRQEGMLAVLLLVTLSLWATDFLHGISPAWVALAAALFCMLPWTRLLPAETFSREVSLSPFFYVAGVLGVGAIIAKTGLGDILGRELLSRIDFKPGHTMQNFFLLTVVSIFIVMLVTSPGLPAVMVPLSADIATATGFPLMTVLMTEVVAFSSPLLLYPVPPMIVGIQLGGLKASETARATLVLGALSVFVFLPINYVWWSLLGVFGSS